ncbi:TonB-dependent siderophore receptor [Glacieibacterium sp.]|uniref:TonB-dependent siderophore receptor n=1 Tax=Glacieibacterium sp. TaxID=2860237 RepID=UPI003B000745
MKSSTSLLCIAVSMLSVSAARADDVVDDTIIVTGSRPATEAIGGTKTATSLLETPQSISVISRDDLDVRGIANLNQALRYTAGITPETRGSSAEVYDQFKLRGFDAPQYLDGLKIFTSPTGYASTQVDVSRLDRVEVVKGPASVLYGASSPGGLIALSSKLPGPKEAYGSVEATYGTFNLFRLDGDIGGSLNPDGSIRFRVSGSVNGADTQQSFGERRRYTISPAITFGAGTPTTVTLIGNYSHDPKNGNYSAVPLSGSLEANPNGRISQKFADGEPDLTIFKRNQGSLTYLATHDFGNDWVLRANGRYQEISALFQGRYITGARADASQALFARGGLNAKERLKNWTFDNQLVGKVVTGPITHNLLFGVDHQNAHSTEDVGFEFLGLTPPINAYNPVYGVPYPLPARDTFYDVHQTQTGVYGQDQMAVGNFRLTLSGRYDWAKGRQEITSAFPSDATKKDGKFTYRVGGLYLTDFGLAPYVSYSTSFEPQASAVARSDGSIGLADPSLGKQIEGGLKYQPKGTPILLTAAYFKIDQTNVVVSNPLTFAATQSGKVRSEGFELEAKVPLFKGLNASANYSRQKIRDRKDDNPFALGKPLIGSARENGGIFLDYTTQAGALQGFGIGGGVRYVGRGYGGYVLNATGVDRYINTPSYTLVDAVVSYDLGRVSERMQGVKLAINAANLFDRRHITSCYVNGVEWCWYGQRRTVQGTIGYRW